jgi:hypothetical protein
MIGTAKHFASLRPRDPAKCPPTGARVGATADPFTVRRSLYPISGEENVTDAPIVASRRPARPWSDVVVRVPRLALGNVVGFLVADVHGRVVGRVTGPMYGVSSTKADALSVRFGMFRWRRRLVPTASISEIDRRTRVIGLRVDREAIRTFL